MLNNQRLPKVHPDLLSSTLQSICGNSRLAKETYALIRDENPVLWALIQVVIDDENKSMKFKQGYCKAAAQFYYLLSTQVECNELNNEYE